MEPLWIVKGDATAPQAEGNKIIVHVCNDLGGWGKGFVVAISRRWPEPERQYRQWHRGRASHDFGLGAVQLVAVQPDLWVANMVAQHGCGREGRDLRSATTPSNDVLRRSPTMPAGSEPPCTCPGSVVGSLVGSGS
jgi:O-acetyl-ADP-ribose deacetylase (regulator of RNase III)